MRLIHGNLWDYANDPKYILCITTNGFVKKNGEAVMGRGCALEAAQRYPKLKKDLGQYISIWGNSLGQFNYDGQLIFTFPVKHKWWEKADHILIYDSRVELETALHYYPDKIAILPKPGCGNGQLEWGDVARIFDSASDNIWIIDNS